MAPSDVDALLRPTKENPPCGPDLEYDAEFMALQRAAVGTAEQQYGATIIAAEPPDWSRVERMATGLCERTLDLRVAALLTSAWTEAQGLAGYASGLRFVDELLARYWDEVHPRLVNDGFEDPLPRMNAIAALTDADGLGRKVRNCVLLEEAGVVVTVRQAEAMLDAGAHQESTFPGGVPRLREALVDGSGKGLRNMAALRDSLALLGHIRATVEQAIGQNWAPDFSRLEKSLTAVLHIVPQAALAPKAEASATSPADTPVAAADPGSGAPPASQAFDLSKSRIASRADVQVLLEKICRFLEETEPSHPAPMLIRRARRLLDLNFVQIIEDLVPEGLAKIEALAGTAKEGSNT